MRLLSSFKRGLAPVAPVGNTSLAVEGQLMLRRTFLLSSAAFALLPRTLEAQLFYRCRTCGAPTNTHLIDRTLPLNSAERARTVCFSCTPEARVIDKYWYGFPTAMHARTHNVKCSECGVELGYILVVGKPFDCRLCGGCAPEAKDCRRWVRDLT